jgi:hypothetical protein
VKIALTKFVDELLQLRLVQKLCRVTIHVRSRLVSPGKRK